MVHGQKNIKLLKCLLLILLEQLHGAKDL